VKDGESKPADPAAPGEKQSKLLGEKQSKLLEEARTTALDVVVEMLAGVHRAKQQLDEDRGTGRGCGAEDEDDPPRVTVDGSATAGDLLFDLARLQLDIVKQVLAFQRHHGDALFDRLYRKPPLLGTETAAPLVLRGSKVDGWAHGSLVVDNRGSKKAQVSLRLSQLRSRDGRQPFRAEVVFKPQPSFELEPDQERTVEITVTLDDRFKPGHRYRGEVEIAMAGCSKQQVPVRIEVAGADPESPGPAP
jgi:hypothetical protein